MPSPCLGLHSFQVAFCFLLINQNAPISKLTLRLVVSITPAFITRFESHSELNLDLNFFLPKLA